MLRELSLLCLCVLTGALASVAENSLHHQLDERVGSTHVRPVEDFATALPVTAGLSVTDVDVDAGHHKVAVSGWLHMGWNVSALSWEDAEDEAARAIPDVRMDESEMWTPDIMPYNMLPCNDWKVKTLAVVMRSGQVHYVPMVHFTVRCRHELSSDSERLICPVKLGSWTYSTGEMDLTADKDHVDLTYFHENGDWVVESGAVEREEKLYECCPDQPYTSLNINLVLKPQRS